MKRIIASLLFATSAVSAQTYVAPRIDKNGVYHDGHYRSSPDSQRSNNLNSQNNQYGGTNPYTGQRGTQRDEHSSPPVYNRSSPQYVPPVTDNPYAPQQQRQPRQPRSPWQ